MRKLVLIVESEEKQIQRIVSVIKETVIKTGKKMDIYTANTWKEAEVIIQETEIDILILDVLYKGMVLEEYPGVKWAQRLRGCEKYISLPIIFISSVEELKMYAYREINCLGFLGRQFKKEELQRILEKAIHHSTAREGERTVWIRAKGKVCPVRIRDILYVEVLDRILYIYQANGNVLEMPHKPLRDFEVEMNSKCLIQCNKSMLINTLYIKEVNEKEGTLVLADSDISLLVGKKYLPVIEKVLKRRKPRFILK